MRYIFTFSGQSTHDTEHTQNKNIQNVGYEEQLDLTLEEVKRTMKTFKSNKTINDEISMDMILEAGDYIILKITKLLNLRLKLSKMPKTWKTLTS